MRHIKPLLCLLQATGSAESGSKPRTQAELAKLLHSNPTSLSRFVSLADPRIPSPVFIKDLYKAAHSEAATTGHDLGVTLEALQDLRTSAEGERRGCQQCVELGERIDSLTQQLNAPCPSCVAYQKEQEESVAEVADLRKRMAALRAEMQAMETIEAGLQVRLAMAKASRTPLPVPRRQRDRQRSKQEVTAARQLTARAGELDAAGKENEALGLLHRGTIELLTPAETALVIVELRQQKRDHLADNLIHVYSRDQADRPVMAVAMELHEEGAVDDAGAVLRAALR
ncbi:hypothetical protein D9753_22120 [Streptomyces dangxiongensis]|uniref:Uncharacterized protein n=1 Tax=Streptomyces dangxiongensis TaxID=1442032 RepID=A0A3G2JIB0_9ACTN|nr:hypothetical protein [Streptomyces dangxiongensis]AYN41125.1 hypothetical protein D9753_22120 [Streptomyces dangxiongensis]